MYCQHDFIVFFTFSLIYFLFQIFVGLYIYLMIHVLLIFLKAKICDTMNWFYKRLMIFVSEYAFSVYYIS